MYHNVNAINVKKINTFLKKLVNECYIVRIMYLSTKIRTSDLYDSKWCNRLDSNPKRSYNSVLYCDTTELIEFPKDFLKYKLHRFVLTRQEQFKRKQ